MRHRDDAMTRDPIPFHVADLADFARALRAGLPIDAPHQAVMNAVARAAGFRNLQHLRASRGAAEAEPPPDLDALRRAAARFDAEGRFTGWPARHALRTLCLWPIWAGLPVGGERDERAISAAIHALCTFRDAAGIRREMVGEGMLRRERDGTGYARIERRPGPTERALIAAVHPRRRRASPRPPG